MYTIDFRCFTWRGDNGKIYDSWKFVAVDENGERAKVNGVPLPGYYTEQGLIDAATAVGLQVKGMI